MGIIQASIPLFFALIALEVIVARTKRADWYRLNDSLGDLACGILSQLSGIFTKLLTFGIYAWILERFAIQRWAGAPAWTEGPLAWAVVFVLVDLQYYFAHRYSHEINLFWASHVVHHSSEEYNLTVALRQTATGGLIGWVFYVPLAVLGVPLVMYVTCYGINLIYQFWIHTRAVGTLGRWTEWVMNTPSHHRVHHGVNPKYQDKNYAGVFIVWDRLFGTFIQEEEEPVYGITHPLRSFNPLWANVHVWLDIARSAARARSVREALGYVFGPPGWRPADLGGREVPPEVSRATFAKYDPSIPRALGWYGLVQFGVALAGALAVLLGAKSLSMVEAGAGTFAVALSLAAIGGIFEGDKWAGVLETARLGAAALAALGLYLSGALGAMPAAAVIGFCALSLSLFLPQRRHLTGLGIAPMM